MEDVGAAGEGKTMAHVSCNVLLTKAMLFFAKNPTENLCQGYKFSTKLQKLKP